MNVKKMKMQLMATAASVLISGIALTSATYAWYVANNTVEAVTTNISATTNGFIFFFLFAGFFKLIVATR